ncbi:MAG: MFS transporter [Rhodospirillales bacterium]|nr:MFS transporter [Rhodospirillales bacterium]MBO6785635.1 MFS transporter [Rhodospirillales bacterium]
MNDENFTPAITSKLALATITGVTAVQVIATMAMLIPAAIAPELARTLGLPVAMIGFQISLAYVGATVMSLAAGLVQRRLGAVRANQTAAFIIMTSLSIIAIPHVAALGIGTFGLGIAYGLTNPAAAHLMMKVATGANRNLIFSIKQTGQPLGGVVAGLVAPPIAVAFGWQWSLLAGAGLACVVMLAIQPLRPLMDGDRDPATKFRGAVFKDVGLLLRMRNLRLLALCGLCLAAVQLALMGFAVAMLAEEIELDLVTAGVGLAVIQVAGVIGRIGWGAVADRVGDARRTLIVSQLISVAAGLATAILAPGMPLALIFGILFMFGMSAVGWNGVFMAEVARMAPEGRTGSATGGVLVPVFIGVMIGPVLFTGIHELLGVYTLSFAVLSGLTVAGIIPMLVIGRTAGKSPKPIQN